MSAGRPMPHESARQHVTGTARYIDDIPTPPGCLHLAFGMSPEAHGLILSMDLADVRVQPGVVAAWTAYDLDRPADVSPSAHDEPLLSTGEVHFHGQPLFLVAATSHRAARAATKRAWIEFEKRLPLVTIDEALAAESYIDQGPITWTKGDVDAALADAHKVIEGTIEIGGQEHFYLEGQVALAVPGEAGEITVYSSTQHPTEIQHKVAEALDLPMHSVRIEVRRMGGAFGGKESQGNALAVACAIAAQKTGRPCKMRYDRDDDMAITGKRHDFRISYRAGITQAGKLTGLDFTHYVRAGWSADLTLPVADRAMLHADNAYFVPAMRIVSHRLRTNTASATAFRGFGGPQGMLGIERVMDHIAHETGQDPLAIRKKNFYAKTKAQETHYGQPVPGFVLPDMVKQLETNADYEKRRADVAAWNKSHEVLKRGIALTPVKFGISFTLTHLNQAGALVNVYTDGSVGLSHGGTEMGQGLHLKVCQVAARAFGIDLSRVRVAATDTSKVPNTSATAASSGSDLNGMAVKIACEEIKTRMTRFLAHAHGVRTRQIAYRDGGVHVGGVILTFAEAVQACYEGRVGLSAAGYYRTPGLEWDREKGQGHPFFYFAYGAAITEVVLDTLTGEYRILRADILHDVGESLNPAIDLGQIEGGYVQGVGWLTTEELVWDKSGRLATHAPSTYKIPAASDAPEVFNVTLWGKPNEADTIYRSKAVGEPPLMLGISALMALSDAAAACGARYPGLDAPATPERMLWAVKKVRR